MNTIDLEEISDSRLNLARAKPVLVDANLVRVASEGQGFSAGVGAVRTDSRRVSSGDCFVAYKGVKSDGHNFLPAAIARGAQLLIVEDQRLVPIGTTVRWIEVKNARAAWAHLAAEAHGNPQKDLTLLGVTGTNGKTSTACMTAALLRACAVPCLFLGTLGADFDGTVKAATGHTTPDPDILFGLLAAAKSRGISTVAMEVSSHSVAHEKLGPMRFSAGAFTSFSRDHLDLHGTMEDYWAAKWRFVTELCRPKALRALCRDLPLDAVRLGQLENAWLYSLGRNWSTDSSIRHLGIDVTHSSLEGTAITAAVNGGESSGFVPYFARHALENFAAALLLSSVVVGKIPEPKYWRQLPPVPGRLQVVAAASATQPTVIVDYAHTPDALEKTLKIVRPLCRGALRVVFGCGGDRDSGKRPIMGRIASELAHVCYITSDNPRSEDPASIIASIVSGVVSGSEIHLVVDRRAAIAQAIYAATPNDLVLIAGKGHETYQIIAGQNLPFDDGAVAGEFLRAREVSSRA